MVPVPLRHQTGTKYRDSRYFLHWLRKRRKGNDRLFLGGFSCPAIPRDFMSGRFARARARYGGNPPLGPTRARCQELAESQGNPWELAGTTKRDKLCVGGLARELVGGKKDKKKLGGSYGNSRIPQPFRFNL